MLYDCLEVCIQELSLQVRRRVGCISAYHSLYGQMHYNEGADLLTYLVDPSVFAIKGGYVEALQGERCWFLHDRTCLHSLYRPGIRH